MKTKKIQDGTYQVHSQCYANRQRELKIMRLQAAKAAAEKKLLETTSLGDLIH